MHKNVHVRMQPIKLDVIIRKKQTRANEIRKKMENIQRRNSTIFNDFQNLKNAPAESYELI